MPWWRENRLRMVQFNLIATDAATDVDKLVRWLKDMHANAVMIGAGGIVAYYPSRLPYVYPSPHMGSRDMLGEVIEKCHQNGIRVIGRFDFSKVHESIARQHPEWLYRDSQGNVVNYHGMVHTCLSGEYQSRLSLEMLRDCLETHPVDGLFFNMFGYPTFDYDGVDHGICQCESCRRLFREETGFELPKTADDPHFEAYKAFKQRHIDALVSAVHRVVKGISPEISICTHDSELLDMVHNESQTALNRKPAPFWIYDSSEHCRRQNDSYAGSGKMYAANDVINAADIGWRFVGVSPYLTQIRLWQNAAAGSQPEWCIVGLPENYPDSKTYDYVREVFQYHEQNEQYLGQRKTLAKILLVYPGSENFWPSDPEYRGIFTALKEGHYNFDICIGSRLKDIDLTPYKTVIVPNASIDLSLFGEDVNIIATGRAFDDDPETLKTYFGGELDHAVENNAGAYMLCRDKQLFKRIPECDWILVDGPSRCIRFEEGTLDYMAPGVFGPVEIAGGTFPSGFYSAGIKRTEKRTNVLLPWEIGKLYYQQGFPEHRDVLLDLLDMVGTPGMETNAHPMVEIFCDGCEGGRILQLVNLTGMNGTAVNEPVPFAGIELSVPAQGSSRAVNLRTGEALPVRLQDGMLRITLPSLTNFGAILIPEA